MPLRRAADGAAEQSRSRRARRIRRHVFEDDFPRTARGLRGAAGFADGAAVSRAPGRRLARLHADADRARNVHAQRRLREASAADAQALRGAPPDAAFTSAEWAPSMVLTALA